MLSCLQHVCGFPCLRWRSSSAIADAEAKLRLGKGSWGTAYRSSGGSRREAFRLLFLTSIVTSLELSDDLTVVSDVHIDECVLIALDMLQRRRLDVWVRNPEDAIQFFERRLAAMYGVHVPEPCDCM